MRRFISKVFFFTFVLAAIGYCLGLLATEVSPQLFWPLAFFGLGFPIFFVLLIFYALYWLLSTNKKMLAPFILLLLGYFIQPSFYALSFFKNKKDKDAITVMSYNVRNFNLYTDRTGAQRDEMIALIKENQPDILCLQEAFTAHNFITEKQLLQAFDLSESHFELGVRVKNNRDFGILTLSKYPIIHQERIDFNARGNLAMRTDLLIDDDTVSVYNLHLASLHFSPEDYEFLEQIQEGENDKDVQVQKAKSIMNKLKDGFIRRSSQAKKVRENIKNNSHAKIVCGDFNDTSMSYAYSTIKADMQDAFTKANYGAGRTYVGIPFLRIDHIFASDEFKVLDHDICRKDLSDHYPVVVKLKK